LVSLIVFAIASYFGYLELFEEEPAELSVHFLELGNKFTGDCIFIKAGDKDILIDAGSRASSIPTITGYINKYCGDGKLEFVIVTHAHQDHYAGFATGPNAESIFDLYECEVIIDFALTNQSPTATMYSNYIRERDDEVAKGATHYTARQCIEEGRSTFDLGGGITLRVLDSYYYYNESSEENNYSVCVLISHGDRHFLFTGDLEGDREESGERKLVEFTGDLEGDREESGERKLVELNPDLPEVEVYKAGHHGSKSSSHDVLLEKIKPRHVVVCCCAGSSEYTDASENQFPTQEFIDRIESYTDRVYVTTLSVDYKNNIFKSFNGNIVFYSASSGVTVSCSDNDVKLKDSDWFKENRITPPQWQ
jgi:competence protein ComEC